MNTETSPTTGAMTDAQRIQARALHHQQVQGETLGSEEHALVQRFLQTVEQEDAAHRAAYSSPQADLLAAKEARNRKLADLLQRQQQVAQRLHDALVQAETERRDIARERQQIESVPL